VQAGGVSVSLKRRNKEAIMSRMGLASRALGCAIALSGLVGGAVGARAQDASQMS